MGRSHFAVDSGASETVAPEDQIVTAEIRDGEVTGNQEIQFRGQLC